MSKRSRALVVDVGEQQQVGVGADPALDLASRGAMSSVEAEQVGDAAGDVEVGVEIAASRQQDRPVRQAARRRPAA